MRSTQLRMRIGVGFEAYSCWARIGVDLRLLGAGYTLVALYCFNAQGASFVSPYGVSSVFARCFYGDLLSPLPCAFLRARGINVRCTTRTHSSALDVYRAVCQIFELVAIFYFL